MVASTTPVQTHLPSPSTSPTIAVDIGKKTGLLPPVLSLGEGYDFEVNQPPTGRPIRVYADGIYDMCHFGHAKALEQAKKSFDNVYLLVGVCSDKETHKRKGKTVMTDTERYEALRHIKWVDEVVEDAPWIITQDFIDKHQIDYVAHDAEPYVSSDSGDVYSFVKAQGKFLPTQRTDGISTSDLITRIVRDYDAYLRRNLERGVTAKELNISFLKEKEIKTKKSIDDIRKQLLSLVVDHLDNWENQHHHLIMGFAARFGAESMVEKFINKGRLLSGKNTPTSSSCNNSIKGDSDDE
ncbi:hypothetical protein BC941DRAFT_403780 [Chlamydoabsidia padenii]|nr:hypothetical protein BC941DRAFT_403780 [Chlamydoabsidia padenii]